MRVAFPLISGFIREQSDGHDSSASESADDSGTDDRADQGGQFDPDQVDENDQMTHQTADPMDEIEETKISLTRLATRLGKATSKARSGSKVKTPTEGHSAFRSVTGVRVVKLVFSSDLLNAATDQFTGPLILLRSFCVHFVPRLARPNPGIRLHGRYNL